MRSPRVVLADDVAGTRDLVRWFLEEDEEGPRVEVVGEADNGTEVLPLVMDLRPDVVLMDARMPALDGISCTRLLAEEAPDVKVIVFSVFDDPDLRRMAEEAGAYAFMVKGSDMGEVRRTIVRAAEA